MKAKVKAALKQYVNNGKAAFYPKFFKTRKGDYGEGDWFMGVTVPNQRKVAKQFKDLPLQEVKKLLDDKIHECRLTALFILIEQFRRGDELQRQEIAQLYSDKMDRVNNWDLVDSSAYKILGAYLEDKDRKVLDDLAASNDLWRQRISIVATYHFIRLGEFKDTLRISRKLLKQEHDLIQKAVGWMLREVGNRDKATLERFLKRHIKRMPRVTLRYAIERFPERQRQKYLRGEI